MTDTGWVERGTGERIWWQALGHGRPALVLVMGLGCGSAMWFRIAPALAARRRVILLDKPAVLEQARSWGIHLLGFA